MKKHYSLRKAFSLALILSMVTLCTACGFGRNNNTNNNQGTTASPTPDTNQGAAVSPTPGVNQNTTDNNLNNGTTDNNLNNGATDNNLNGTTDYNNNDVNNTTDKNHNDGVVGDVVDDIVGGAETIVGDVGRDLGMNGRSR